MGGIIVRDGVPSRSLSGGVELLADPEQTLVFPLDHILDDELRQLDHKPAQLGIFLAKGIPFRALVLRATSARKIATMIVAVTRRRRYMRHG